MPNITMMKFQAIILILFAFIYSCSNNISHSGTHDGITIRINGPRGSVYKDSSGKEFGFRVFKTHLINDTIIPIELTINFSNDSIVLPTDSITSPVIPKSDRYVKVFLFPRSMMPDKHEEVYNYGISGIESFLDTGLNKPTSMKIVIQPKQDYILYIGALLYPEFQRAHSKMLIERQNLVYRILLDPPLDSALIPCGRVVFKK